MKRPCIKKILVLMMVIVGNIICGGQYVNAQDVETPVFFGVEKVNKTSVVLSWECMSDVDGYEILSYNANTKKYTKIKSVSKKSNVQKITITGLKSNTKYRYAIRSYVSSKSGNIYSAKSPVIVFKTKQSYAVTTKLKNRLTAGYFADITAKPIEVKGNHNTTSDSERHSYTPYEEYYDEFGLMYTTFHGDWVKVSDVTQFWDNKGNYNIAYVSGKYLYIERYNKKLEKLSTIKIWKKYELLGDVLTDKKGFYCVVWGQNDTAGKGGVVTMAVSKYSYEGVHEKTLKYKTEGGCESWETRFPFDAGNCDTIITSEGILVCNYGREMYNGHQSNDVLCVDTASMNDMGDLYGNYVSHSFDQRVLQLANGDICFVNKGDGYPRGFDVDFYGELRCYDIPLHFYGNCGANYIYASLGGVVEVGGNTFLVGSSAKSYSEACRTEAQNLFVTIVNGFIREIDGTTEENTDERYGIKWLTNYSGPYTVNNPQVVKTDDGRMVILWEKMKDGEFVQSYYMILSSDGMIEQEATPMNKVRLNAYEEPLYASGYVYWTSVGRVEEASVEVKPSYNYCGYKVVDGDKGIIYKLKIGSLNKYLKTPKISELSNEKKGINVKWNTVAGATKYSVFRKEGSGKWKKLADTTDVNYTDTTAKSGKSYSYSVRCVSNNGKKYTSKASSNGNVIRRLLSTTVTAANTSKGVQLKWKKVAGAAGYYVYRKTVGGTYKKIKTIRNGKTLEYIDTSVKENKGKTYVYAVRGYTGSSLGIMSFKKLKVK